MQCRRIRSNAICVCHFDGSLRALDDGKHIDEYESFMDLYVMSRGLLSIESITDGES